MKRYHWLLAIVAISIFGLSGCEGKMASMQNSSSEINPASNQAEVKSDKDDQFRVVLPHQSLGLEPTAAVCRGDISTYEMFFAKRLYAGEWFPGQLRHNTRTISDKDGSERHGQILFSGMHPSGHYFGKNVIDGQIFSGYTVIESFMGDYIYSPLENELAVDREKWRTNPAYRREKIIEVNTDKNGHIFNLSSLRRDDEFKSYIKTFNQLQAPDGYLLTPYGVDEIAKIRGINPQYTYFEKLIGTGKFSVVPTTDVVSFAFINSINILMDMIGAVGAASRGWDFGSQISRRQMSFVVEYALRLAEKEIQNRNTVNVELVRRLKEVEKENGDLKIENEKLRRR